MQTLSHILTHNSIRYRRFFDIIEFVYRFIIELPLRFSITQFDC